jgi:hypothetical protein
VDEEQIGQPTETTPEPAETTEQPTPASEAGTGAEAPPAAEVEAPAPPPYDWRKALDEAPADELRRHPKFAGILGSEKPRWQQEWTAQQQAEADRKAAEKAREDLKQRARANPVAFADEWLGSEEAREQEERLQGLETKARQDLASQLGAALHGIDEWAGVIADPEALSAFTLAPAGKPPGQELPAIFEKAADLIAEKRARARFEKWKADELPKEREALKAEITAELLAQSDRPDLVRAAARAKRGSWEDLPPGPEFDREYARHMLGR